MHSASPRPSPNHKGSYGVCAIKMGVQDILRTKLQRISKEQHAPREHLLSTKSLDTLRISLLSFKVAVTKPYVFEKLKRYCACDFMPCMLHLGTIVASNTSAQSTYLAAFAHRYAVM